MSRVGSIRQEGVAQFTIYWDIRNNSENIEHILTSPNFFLWGAEWYLKLYPKGLIDSRFMAIYLIRGTSTIRSHQVEFKLGIIKENGLMLYENFKILFTEKSCICGTPFFIERSQRYESKLTSGEVLTCSCSMNLLSNFTADVSVQTETLTGEGSHEDIRNEKKDSSRSDIEGTDILITNLKDLFLNEEDYDVTFKVEDQEFYAHRVLLAARSPVFASMFKHDMSEKNTGVVSIPDCGSDAFKELLLYLYSGTASNLSSNITFDLFEASVKYDLEHLKKQSVQFMRDDLSVLTFCDILAISLKHDEMELIDIATAFFTNHIEEILPTMTWQTFLKENHIVANELLIKAIKKK